LYHIIQSYLTIYPQEVYNDLIVHRRNPTQVGRRGTQHRSSMETLLLTCLQAQLLIKRIEVTNLTTREKNDLIWEVKQVSRRECNLDGNAAPRNGN
jgi:hypothetical protein